jgi:hypothetical protein
MINASEPAPSAALRNRKFFSIEELNQAIRELRDRINQRPFRKREGSRATQFAAVDKPAMGSLPAERFDLSEWSRARVNIDYHIAFDTNYYSVPYNLVHELVEVRSTPTTIEIFHKSQRVASHLRARGHGNAVTVVDHRPRSHQAHLEWTPSRMVHWAQSIGPHTARLFERILADKPHPEMGYRSHPPCRSVLPGSHGSCGRACTDHGLVPLSKRQVDPEELARRNSSERSTAAVLAASTRQHPWLGVLLVNESAMLKQPMIEKLAPMRLLLATAGLALARTDRRSHVGRWHPGSAGS